MTPLNMTPQEIIKMEGRIAAALRTVFDPEIPVNIYDLGLVYDIDYQADGVANITMTLTAPACPMADILVEDVKAAVAKIEGVSAVTVELTFDPPWDNSRLSDEARLELGLL